MKGSGKTVYKQLLVTLLSIIVVALVACSSPVATAASQTPTASPAYTSTPTAAPVQTGNPTDFVLAVARVYPSVVKVEVRYGPQGAPGNPSATAGAGSGWVIGQNGLIVTNNHVVAGAQSITVTLADGTQYPSLAVKGDAQKDLAVIRIAAQSLTPLAIGDSSSLRLGQPVAAIGNALDLGVRVTTGVVSLLNVPISYDSISMSGLIETDTTINPGNSGGVLIDLLGEVVGITNAGLDGTTLDTENFNYAIAIDEAMPVINSLISQLP